MRAPIGSPRLRLALLGIALATLLVAGPPELRLGIAYVAPFLLLLAALLADRYPGEQLLIALTERAPRMRGASGGQAPVVRPAMLKLRGGLLLDLALAARPPPSWIGSRPTPFTSI